MNRIEESRNQLKEIKSIDRYVSCILAELGEPRNDQERLAMYAFTDAYWDECKELCLKDPCNAYLACLSCLASAMRSPMIADSVLRDASRHCTEVSKENCAKRISEAFRSI